MKNYLIGSSSNLLEGNAAWDTLRNQVTLTFQNFGDISSGLVSPNDNGVIITIFLEDLIKNCLDDYSLVAKSNKALFDLIGKRSVESDEPIIICHASRAYASAVASARRDTKIKAFFDDLISKLIELRNESSTVYVINLNDIFYKRGSDQMFSDRNWYFGRCRLSIDGLGVLVNSISEVVDRINNSPKKVLVLDCDNTLWGGVIGEDGLKNLVLGQDGLGQAFIDFQKECLRLSNEGVLLALASKNNEEDVWNVFENHPSMILKRENILRSKINWNEKSANLIEMSKELDLGIDSFVFWDDNPIERSKVNTVLPEVLTVEAPQHVIEWPNLIRDLNCFSKFEITSEDLNKSIQYKSRAAFVSDVNHVTDINSYLKSINLLPSKISLCDTNMARAEQLCKKTNQFNLRTKRYTASELQAQNSDTNIDMFLVGLRDNYGDHGIVGLVGLKFATKDICLIDIFLMSCRVLGRHLEAWMLNEIVMSARQRGARKLLVDFIESAKNVIAEDFLINYGFKLIEDENLVLKLSKENANCILEGKLYQLSLNDTVIPNIEIYEGNNNGLT